MDVNTNSMIRLVNDGRMGKDLHGLDLRHTPRSGMSSWSDIKIHFCLAGFCDRLAGGAIGS
jgi:hypothetical protein